MSRAEIYSSNHDDELMMMQLLFCFFGSTNCAACAMKKLADNEWNPPLIKGFN